MVRMYQSNEPKNAAFASNWHAFEPLPADDRGVAGIAVGSFGAAGLRPPGDADERPCHPHRDERVDDDGDGAEPSRCAASPPMNQRAIACEPLIHRMPRISHEPLVGFGTSR